MNINIPALINFDPAGIKKKKKKAPACIFQTCPVLCYMTLYHSLNIQLNY